MDGQAFVEMLKSFNALKHREYGTSIASSLYFEADTPINSKWRYISS